MVAKKNNEKLKTEVKKIKSLVAGQSLIPSPVLFTAAPGHSELLQTTFFSCSVSSPEGKAALRVKGIPWQE